MAAGDIGFFNQYLVDVLSGKHNQASDDIRLGLVTNATVPTISTPNPTWGAGGATNFSLNQVTPGGNYSSGGPAIANLSVSLISGAAYFDGDDVVIAQNASNPSGAYWAIIYNNTLVNKECLGFIDLNGPVDLSAGDFTITWNAQGILSLSRV